MNPEKKDDTTEDTINQSNPQLITPQPQDQTAENHTQPQESANTSSPTIPSSKSENPQVVSQAFHQNNNGDQNRANQSYPSMSYSDSSKKSNMLRLVIVIAVVFVTAIVAMVLFAVWNSTTSSLAEVDYTNEKSENYTLNFYKNYEVMKLGDLGISGLSTPQNESQKIAQDREVLVSKTKDDNNKLITIHIEKTQAKENALKTIDSCSNLSNIETELSGYKGPLCPVVSNESGNPIVMLYAFEYEGTWYIVTVTQDYTKNYVKQAEGSQEIAQKITKDSGLDKYSGEITEIITSIKPSK